MAGYRWMLAAGALAMALTGCGTDKAEPSAPAGGAGSATTTVASGAGATTTTAVPKAEFVEAANAICADLIAQVGELRKKVQPGRTALPDQADTILEGAELSETALAGIQSLPQPAEDPATLKAVYDGIGKGIALQREAGAAAKANDQQAMSAVVTRLNGITTEVNAKATAYGLTECAK